MSTWGILPAATWSSRARANDGPRDQRLEGGGSLRRVERPVVRGQRPADRRVVEERQPAQRDRVQEPDAEQSLADRPEVGRPALDQGLQCGLARLEIEPCRRARAASPRRGPGRRRRGRRGSATWVETAGIGASTRAGRGRPPSPGLRALRRPAGPRPARPARPTGSPREPRAPSSSKAFTAPGCASMSSASRRRSTAVTPAAGNPPASATRPSGSASATGIRPVQIRRGRLWSAASSACATSGRGQLEPSIHRQPLERRGQHQPHQPGGSSRARPTSVAMQIGGQLDVRRRPGWLKIVSSGRSSVSSRIAQARTDSCGRVEQRAQERVVGSADRVQRPERPEPEDRIGLLGGDRAGAACPASSSGSPRGRPVGEDAPGLADEPLVRVAVQRHEVACRRACRRSRRRAARAACRT